MLPHLHFSSCIFAQVYLCIWVQKRLCLNDIENAVARAPPTRHGFRRDTNSCVNIQAQTFWHSQREPVRSNTASRVRRNGRQALCSIDAQILPTRPRPVCLSLTGRLRKRRIYAEPVWRRRGSNTNQTAQTTEKRGVGKEGNWIGECHRASPPD